MRRAVISSLPTPSTTIANTSVESSEPQSHSSDRAEDLLVIGNSYKAA